MQPVTPVADVIEMSIVDANGSGCDLSLIYMSNTFENAGHE